MRGDKLLIRKHHTTAARKITGILYPDISSSKGKYVITVSGESGSGKTEIAVEIARFLKSKGIKSVVLHQDDYFRYPPKTNHKMRVLDLAHVGPSEVRLDLLNKHIKQFKTPKTTSLNKPLIYFKENRIGKETLKCKTAKVMIVEGTYTGMLKNVNKKVFLCRTHKDTLRTRQMRAREKIDVLSRKILLIEHRIISKHRKLAHIIVKKDYSVAPKIK